jgi:hypothetical protein
VTEIPQAAAATARQQSGTFCPSRYLLADLDVSAFGDVCVLGFWHTGYMEFHEPTGGGGGGLFGPLPLPTFPCAACGLIFQSERDLRVHSFHGHVMRRPILMFKGRECGRSRLIITSQIAPSDWVVHAAQSASINGTQMSVDAAIELLSVQRAGVVDVALANDGIVREFEFEFGVADEADLDGVDGALRHLIDGGELSRGAINDLIMRAGKFPTAVRYSSG